MKNFWDRCPIDDIYNFSINNRFLLNNIINNSISKCNQEEIKNIFITLTNKKGTPINIYEILLANNSVQLIIIDNYNMYVDTINKLLNTTPYNYNMNDIIGLICNDNTSNVFIKYVTDTLNNNISLMRNPSLHIESAESITTILNIMLLMYFNNYGNVLEIDNTYLVSPICNINWYTKNKNVDDQLENYNMQTKLYFLILNTIRILVVPVENKCIDLSNNIAVHNNIFNFGENIKIMKKKLNKLCGIYTTFNRYLLDKFYNHIIDWVVSNEHIYEIDSIINLINTKNQLKLWKGIVCGLYTNNIDIKISILERVLESDYYEHHELINISDKKLNESIINIYNNLDDANDIGADTLTKIDTIHNYILYRGCDIENNIDGQKFIYILFNNILGNCLEYYTHLLYLIYNIKYEFNGRIMNTINNYTIVNNCTFQNMFDVVSIYMLNISYLLHKLHMTDTFLNYIIHNNMLTDQFIQVIDVLCHIIKITINVPNISSILNNNMYTMALNITDLLHNYLMCDNNETFSSKFYSNLGTKYSTVDVLKDIDSNKIDLIFTPPDNICSDIDYPDEFIDPIVCSVIENPILLPNMKNDIFLDKSTIMRYLFSKKENPFTKETLTIEQLEEYNNTPEIKEKLADFLRRKRNFANK